MKKLLKGLLAISVVVLNLVAFANVASASNIVSYQPEVPKSLK